MSILQKFRNWVGVSRQRRALALASWISIWTLVIEAIRHSEHGVYAYLTRVAAPHFVISYLAVLLVLSGPRSKRPS